MKFLKNLVAFILIIGLSSSNQIFAQKEENIHSGFSLFASYVNQKDDNGFYSRGYGLGLGYDFLIGESLIHTKFQYTDLSYNDEVDKPQHEGSSYKIQANYMIGLGGLTWVDFQLGPGLILQSGKYLSSTIPRLGLSGRFVSQIIPLNRKINLFYDLDIGLGYGFTKHNAGVAYIFL